MQNAKPISVSLHPALQRFVDHEIAAGHFPDADALVNGAIAALCAEQQDEPTEEHRAYMRERLAEAIASLDRGEGRAWDPDDLKPASRVGPDPGGSTCLRSPAPKRRIARLKRLRCYIARDSLDAALRWIDSVDRRLELVAEFPGVGRSRDEYHPGVRSINLGEYLIFFRPIDDGIEFLHIFHGKRKIEDLLRSDDF